MKSVKRGCSLSSGDGDDVEGGGEGCGVRGARYGGVWVAQLDGGW